MSAMAIPSVSSLLLRTLLPAAAPTLPPPKPKPCVWSGASRSRFSDLARPAIADSGDASTSPRSPESEANAAELGQDDAQNSLSSDAEQRSLVPAMAADSRVSKGFFDGREAMTSRQGKGATIVDLLMVFGGLLERPSGSGQMMAAAGGTVVERVKSEARHFVESEETNSEVAFEFLRALSLLEMDLQLLRSVRKKETLLERLEAAKVHCRDAILIADAL